MTPGGSKFNDFPENELTKIYAVYRVLRQIRSGTCVLLFKAFFQYRET